ncbi:MAG: CotH kinase family protein [Saccharospirillaceae bacterium]|nr:CotH kinase family protein [Pseudomonadales bacterium]NRB81324.1 CotH kinase family protein [Saccharospirillaceae bacterium]
MKSLWLLLSVIFISSCDIKQSEPASSFLPKQQLMDITIDDEDYVQLLENKLQNLEFPISIQYNDGLYTGLLRSSGAASRINSRWSFRIQLNDAQTINELNVFNLSAQIFDPTLLATDVASYYYQQAGFPSFKHSHIFLRINGKDEGLKKMIEKVDVNFFEKRQLEVSELFKSGSQISFSFQTGNPDSLPQSSFDKKIPNNENYNTLDQLYYALDSKEIRNTTNSIEQNLDIKQYLKYHAITSFINNLDAFRNNFFLWKTNASAPIKIIPWDYDWAFKRTQSVGLYGHNAIIHIMLKDQEMFEFYKLELENLMTNVDLERDVFPIIDAKALEIKRAYELDPFLNEIYDFEEETNKLKIFITERKAFYIQQLNNFVYTGG